MGAALAVAKRILQHHRYIFESAHGPWKRHLRSVGMDRGELALPPLLNLWGALNEALPEGGEIARLSDKYQRGLENLVGGRALSVLLKSSVRDEVKLTPADKECLVFGVIDPVNQERVSRDDSEADPLRVIAAELEQIRYEPLRRDGSSGPTIATEAPTAATAEFVPGEDFRSVKWCGRSYTFTPNQSACVRMLWEAWQRGTPDLAQETLLERAGSNAPRLRDAFKLSGKVNQAWGTLIVPGDRKGTFRLRLAK